MGTGVAKQNPRGAGAAQWRGARRHVRVEVDSVLHLFGIAVGWGGNPTSAAIYVSVYPKANDGKITHTLSVKDVPVDGFLSVSVCNEKATLRKTISTPIR